MLPVSRPYLDEQELLGVAEVFQSRWLGQGATVRQFEEQLAAFLGRPHVVATNTGTSALHLAMEVLGIGPGDEVIVPSLTFCASVQAIIGCGATPVFCDVCLETLQIDVADAGQRITSRTRAIMPVHFCGIPCDMTALLALANAAGVVVVEDAAHAFGSRYRGRRLGSLGHITCFSFDPIKNITCGEGGALATGREDWAALARRQRMLGIDKDGWTRHVNRPLDGYDVTCRGFRYHMSNISAAIGLSQLKKFDMFRRVKCEIVARYNATFSALPGLEVLPWERHDVMPFAYMVRVTNGRRQALRDALAKRGIGTAIHYPPNHQHSFFRSGADRLPNTETVCEQILTLPLYFEMSDEDVANVITGVSQFLQARSHEPDPAGVRL